VLPSAIAFSTAFMRVTSAALMPTVAPKASAVGFCDKAKDNLTGMGGVEEVAVALSQNPTAEAFGATVGMSAADVTRMKAVLKAIADSNTEGFQVC